jgi:hypothetical protein
MTRYSRTDWRARAVPPGVALDRDQVEGIALHWPATETRYQTPAGVMAALRAWQAYHIDGHGWRDIAYQEAIDQDGNSYVLRGLRYRSAANGNQDVNERFGALLLVLAIGEHPSAAMIATTTRRIARHRSLFPSSRRIVGHMDVRPEPTSCPGAIVEAMIRAGRFTPETSL